MKKSTIIWIHVCFWVYTFFFMEMAMQRANGKPWESILNVFGLLPLSNYIIFLSVFYLNYLLVLPKLLKRNKYWKTLVAWILLAGLYISLRYFIQEVFLYRYFGICNYCTFKVQSYIIVHFFQILTWILLPGTVIWLFNLSLTAERRNIALQQEKIKIERAYLQAQLNPHFIFNSLHTIYSMVFHKAEESLDAIKTFSDILRYVLNPSKAEMVPLADELKQLKKYIAIQEYRNGRPAVNLEINEGVKVLMIPPLLLITLVENAFKHGIYTDPFNPINIQVTNNDEQLFFQVKNKINPNRAENSTSMGLTSTKRILELTYGDNQVLTMIEHEGFYIASLTIKQTK